MSTDERPAWASETPEMISYYDSVWGRPVTTEHAAFALIALEAFQSGLSWLTIWRRHEAFAEAFAGFDVDAVAAFDEARVQELLGNAAIIRNRRKIEATIANARATQALRDRVPELPSGEVEAGLPSLLWHYSVPTRLPESTDAGADGVEPAPTRSPESEALARQLKTYGFRQLGPVSLYSTLAAMGIINHHPYGSTRWKELEADRGRILGHA
ncbi:DNA-3-methyladenine glycosylase I [Neoactinobaculum massilliense]|uniref:DNA-3-methyladenine glycosylase I n=1 Tax=Neoactinobaculum massilliense TaxID=2364794 RepID=UPI000F52AB41|nr:DNA-3-methyladenine glycosylase I [Neoactinobaculum massilliense]